MSQPNRFCTSCGAPMHPGARFCGGCGQQLAAAAGTLQQSPPPQPAPQPQYAPPPQAPPPPPYPQPPGYPLPPYHAPPYQQQAYTPPVPPTPAPAYAYPPSAPQYAAPPAAETLTGIIPGIMRKKGLFGMEALNGVVTNTRIIFAVQTNEMLRQESAGAGGFLAKMAAAATAGYNVWKRYLNIPPEQALRENPQNFAIYLNQIRRVKFDAGRTIFKKGVVSVGVGINRDDDEPAHLEIETVSEKLKFDVATHFQEEARTVLRQAGLIR